MEKHYPQVVAGGGNEDDLSHLIGKTLGQFRVVERIGAGGMAMVFKAYQPALDRYVAIKVLPAYHARDPVFVQRFEREARSVAKLAHPNIVQIHDFGEQDKITYIVMEFVDSGTLKDRLKRPIPIAEVADYIIQAAEGLNCAHSNGIVHRDVKPANMLLRKDGHLLLSDFGIAKILEATAQLTRAGTGIGTPQYMSPEQGMGQPVDRRSDIYSLGIVFFHALAGRVPFSADNPLSVTIKHVNEPLPIEMLNLVNTPASIVRVIQRMSAKLPQDRYQTTEMLVEALGRALMEGGISLPRWRPTWAAPASAPPSVEPITPPLPVKPPISNPGLPSSNPGLPSSSGSDFPPVPGYDLNNAQPANNIMLTCFRCSAQNPSTRLYCTTCGDDLSNKRASADRYLVNGRPVLSRLTLKNGPLAGRSYRFHQDVTTIGRTHGNDFVLPGKTVSRRHARLWFAEGGRWYLEDLQSANGTRLNGSRIFSAVQLTDSDMIHFGDEIVIFNVTYGP